MLKIIKTILIMSALISTNLTLANNGLTEIKCKKGDLVFTATADNRNIDSPAMWGLQLSNKSKLLLGDDGYRLLERMLEVAPTCEDASSRLAARKGEVFICSGELFATKGIYGQVLLSSNSVNVFKTIIAAGNGWVCE